MSRARILGLLTLAAGCAAIGVGWWQWSPAISAGESSQRAALAESPSVGAALETSMANTSSRAPADYSAPPAQTASDTSNRPSLVVLDRVSRRPLAKTAITSADGEPLGVTDELGVIPIDRRDLDPMTAGFLASLGAKERASIVPLDMDRRKDGNRIEATVPAMARLEVRLAPQELAMQMMVDAFELPEIAVEASVSNAWAPGAKEEILQHLRTTRRVVPEFFRAFHAQAPRESTLARAPQESGAPYVLDLPFSGDAVVDVFGQPGFRARRVVRVERGQTSSIDVELTRRAVIAGTLLDLDGKPAPHHLLQVYARSNTNDVVPLFVETAQSNVSFGGFTRLAFDANAWTDEDGRFELEFPFTDDVTLFALDNSAERGPAAAVLRRKLESPLASLEGIELALAPTPRRLRVQLAKPDGTPRSASKAYVSRGLYHRGPLEHVPLALPVDANGWCDLSVLTLDEGDYVVTCTLANGSSISLKEFATNDGSVLDGRPLTLR